MEKEDKLELDIAASAASTRWTVFCIISWFALNMVRICSGSLCLFPSLTRVRMLCSQTIANLNKWIFHRYPFKYPATLTCCHMLACFGLSLATMTARGRKPRVLSQHASRAVLQLSMVFVVSVAAGNAALGYIHVSFAQAIGSTAPLWTVLLAVVLTKRKFPALVYASLGLICLGMLLTVRGEVNFHPIGFALLLTATLTRALKSILQGLLLSAPEERLEPLELLYHMSIRAACVLALWAVVVERHLLFDPLLRSPGLWLCIGASSLVAFLLNLSQFLVTKATSAVTLQVLGNIKVVLLILVSVAIFGNEVSLQAAAGCALCIAGVVLYNQATRNKPPPSIPSYEGQLTPPPGSVREMSCDR